MDAQWLDPCDLRVVDDAAGRPVFELLRPFAFWSAACEREFTVPQGTTTDGPSVPILLAPLIGAQSVGFRAAVLHDWLVRSREVERKVADRVFLEALRVCGVAEDVAQAMYAAVAAYTHHTTYEAPPTEYGSG